MIRTIIFISLSFLALQLFGQFYPNRFTTNVISYTSDTSGTSNIISYFYKNGKDKLGEWTFDDGKLVRVSYFYKNGNKVPNSNFKNGNGKLNFFCYGMYPSKSTKLNGCYGNFTDGLPNGKFQCYIKGKLVEEYSFNNGRVNGVCKKFTTKGILIEETNFVNDSLDGIQRIFSKKGELLTESQYKGDKLHGTLKDYLRGVVILERNYKEGLLDGDFISFNRNGEIEHIEFYVKGKKKRKKK